MKPELSYITLETEAGWVGILGSRRGLRRTTLPQPSPEKARHLLGDSLNEATWSVHSFQELTERLRAYFAGHYNMTFPDRLDLTGATEFQRRVWETTRRIPYGETRSYAWVAQQIKQPGAARAVGQALGRNPLPIIIPCHRVVASDGRLGGFGGGREMKRYLLSREALAARTSSENNSSHLPAQLLSLY